MNLTKRQKFVATSLFLAGVSFFVQYVDVDYRYLAIVGFSLLTFFLSAWGFLEI